MTEHNVLAGTPELRQMVRGTLGLDRDELLLIFQMPRHAADGPDVETVILTARPGERARRLVLAKPMSLVTPNDVRRLGAPGDGRRMADEGNTKLS